jgi:hypothetical protein
MPLQYLQKVDKLARYSCENRMAHTLLFIIPLLLDFWVGGTSTALSWILKKQLNSCSTSSDNQKRLRGLRSVSISSLD